MVLNLLLRPSESVLHQPSCAIAERKGYLLGGGANLLSLDLMQEMLCPKQACYLILNTILSVPETSYFHSSLNLEKETLKLSKSIV